MLFPTVREGNGIFGKGAEWESTKDRLANILIALLSVMKKIPSKKLLVDYIIGAISNMPWLVCDWSSALV